MRLRGDCTAGVPGAGQGLCHRGLGQSGGQCAAREEQTAPRCLKSAAVWVHTPSPWSPVGLFGSDRHSGFRRPSVGGTTEFRLVVGERGTAFSALVGGVRAQHCGPCPGAPGPYAACPEAALHQRKAPTPRPLTHSGTFSDQVCLPAPFPYAQAARRRPAHPGDADCRPRLSRTARPSACDAVLAGTIDVDGWLLDRAVGSLPRVAGGRSWHTAADPATTAPAITTLRWTPAAIDRARPLADAGPHHGQGGAGRRGSARASGFAPTRPTPRSRFACHEVVPPPSISPRAERRTKCGLIGYGGLGKPRSTWLRRTGRDLRLHGCLKTCSRDSGQVAEANTTVTTPDLSPGTWSPAASGDAGSPRRARLRRGSVPDGVQPAPNTGLGNPSTAGQSSGKGSVP